MNILLTNDDGYKASGINELFQALSTEHKVFLIAPRDNCSGMSAAISLRKEIEVGDTASRAIARRGSSCAATGRPASRLPAKYSP